MYDLHVGDRFTNKQGGTTVTIIELDPLDNRVRYEFDGSGAKRWAEREKFLTRFPIVSE